MQGQCMFNLCMWSQSVKKSVDFLHSDKVNVLTHSGQWTALLYYANICVISTDSLIK